MSRSKYYKIFFAIIILIIAIMAFTNPSLSEFKSYTDSIGFNSKCKFRKSNYLICSTYQCGDYTFVAAFKKFFIIESPFD